MRQLYIQECDEMVNPIFQIIEGIASTVALIISYTVFAPIIDNNLRSMVLDSLLAPTGMLAVNAGSFSSTANIIVLAVKVAYLMFGFGIVFRLFFYPAFLTQEVAYG